MSGAAWAIPDGLTHSLADAPEQEPAVQYLVNGNSYFNPFTARRPKAGVYGGFTLSVPLGTLLGLAPG